ncbi:MAG: non-ribosomal peptide synthetase, partial [Ruminococcus sp.]|nr:non-ribosomal peptide synthetase [Ruminococcus sp.]
MENRSNNAAELVSRLAAKGVKLWTENDKIKYKAGAGALGKEDIAQLKEYKQEVIDLLNAMKGRIRLVEDRDGRYEPFVLTDVQQSYLMGRKKLFDYGGVACHIYLQLDYDHIDVARAEEIWNKLIAHHEMLRAVVHEEGYQQIMEKAPHFTVTDLGDMDGAEVMAKMGHSCYQVGSWPYFSVAVTNYENSAIMHFSIEFLIADWTSIWLLLLQFEGMYFGRITELP